MKSHHYAFPHTPRYNKKLFDIHTNDIVTSDFVLSSFGFFSILITLMMSPSELYAITTGFSQSKVTQVMSLSASTSLNVVPSFSVIVALDNASICDSSIIRTPITSDT
jgi:hypothetical protein